MLVGSIDRANQYKKGNLAKLAKLAVPFHLHLSAAVANTAVTRLPC